MKDDIEFTEQDRERLENLQEKMQDRMERLSE